MWQDIFILDYGIASARRKVEDASRKLRVAQKALRARTEIAQSDCRHFVRIEDQENVFGTTSWRVTLSCRKCTHTIMGVEKNPRCLDCMKPLRFPHKRDYRARREELVSTRCIVVGSEPVAYRCGNARCKKLHVLQMRRELSDEEQKLVAEKGPIFNFPKGWPKKVKKGPA